MVRPMPELTRMTYNDGEELLEHARRYQPNHHDVHPVALYDGLGQANEKRKRK